MGFFCKSGYNIQLIMVKKIAVTGRPGCGKTTLCKKLIEKSRGDVGGLITEEIREGGRRVGFTIKDISTDVSSLLAHVDKCSGPEVGRYNVCLDELNSIGTGAIKNGLIGRGLLIVDEIGPMELKSNEFVKLIESTLDKGINSVFTIHGKSRHPLLEKIREQFYVKRLTRSNRDRVLEKIVKKLKL